ncbi:MAG TPA: bifunctional helix-turn-helix transcriptional regulator/GNAT family N-acetyltransferase [Candidatus Dormibacteraeota bacterium]
MLAAQVEVVRAFNRTVAQRIGALDEAFLGRPRPMVESRVLWQIGPAGIEVRALRARLGLDSGYMSRVLRSLEAQGLVAMGGAVGDRRVRWVRLTCRGAAERDELERRSERVAAGLLERLSDLQRVQLVAAMRAVNRLLWAAGVQIAPEDPRTADAKMCLQSYFAELNARFEGGFDPDLSISATSAELVPPAGLLLVARLESDAVGCGALKFHDDAPAEIKRMWVAPSARGLGVGRRLLEELEAEARMAGARAVRLETNRALSEAIELYRSSGYVEVSAFNDEPYAHHWFEKKLA